jgi:hypothetical protein
MSRIGGAEMKREIETVETTSILSRLGYVLGWAANLFAAFLIFGAVVELLGYTSDPPDMRLSFAGYVGFSAFAIFLIGRALRYILAGSKPAR